MTDNNHAIDSGEVYVVAGNSSNGGDAKVLDVFGSESRAEQVANRVNEMQFSPVTRASVYPREVYNDQ